MSLFGTCISRSIILLLDQLKFAKIHEITKYIKEQSEFESLFNYIIARVMLITVVLLLVVQLMSPNSCLKMY